MVVDIDQPLVGNALDDLSLDVLVARKQALQGGNAITNICLLRVMKEAGQPMATQYLGTAGDVKAVLGHRVELAAVASEPADLRQGAGNVLDVQLFPLIMESPFSIL